MKAVVVDERVVAEDEGAIRMSMDHSQYHLHNHFEEMRLRIKDNWPSTAHSLFPLGVLVDSSRLVMLTPLELLEPQHQLQSAPRVRRRQIPFQL